MASTADAVRSPIAGSRFRMNVEYNTLIASHFTRNLLALPFDIFLSPHESGSPSLFIPTLSLSLSPSLNPLSPSLSSPPLLFLCASQIMLVVWTVECLRRCMMKHKWMYFKWCGGKCPTPDSVEVVIIFNFLDKYLHSVLACETISVRRSNKIHATENKKKRFFHYIDGMEHMHYAYFEPVGTMRPRIQWHFHLKDSF